MSVFTNDQRHDLQKALDEGLHDLIKKSLSDFMFQKSGDTEKSYAEHFKKEIKIIFDVYETAKDSLNEFLDTYR